MTIVLTTDEQRELVYFRAIYGHDTESGLGFAESWGFRTNAPDVARNLVEKGFLAVNPNDTNKFYITIEGGLLVGLETVISPFDAQALIDARAEIARLTAALAESEQARRIADAGWSEAMQIIETQAANLKIDESLIGGYRETIEELKQEIRMCRDEIPF